MGAIQNSGATRGYFVTTGTFSIGAEEMAKSNHIELLDRGALKELISTAMDKGVIPPVPRVQDLFADIEP